MRKKPHLNRRRLEQIIFVAFIVFCVGVLAWDYNHNGFTASWAQLPASDPNIIPEPDTDANSAADNADSSLTDAEAAESVFASLRMDREQARGDELALLTQIIADENSSDVAKEDAEQRRLAMAQDMENEISAESLLQIKGYGQTVVMVGARQTTVIIDLEISSEDANIIAEIVDKACACGFENVVIVKR